MEATVYSRGPVLRVRLESIQNGWDKKIPTVFCLPHRPGAVNHLTQPDPIRVMSLVWAGLKSMSSSGLGIPKSCRNTRLHSPGTLGRPRASAAHRLYIEGEKSMAWQHSPTEDGSKRADSETGRIPFAGYRLQLTPPPRLNLKLSGTDSE